jgi:hypothetical protein
MVFKYKNKKFRNFSLMTLKERNYKIPINYQVNYKHSMGINLIRSNQFKIQNINNIF